MVYSKSASEKQSDSLQRRANARNVSFRISLRWPIDIINQVDKTKLARNSVALKYDNRTTRGDDEVETDDLI